MAPERERERAINRFPTMFITSLIQQFYIPYLLEYKSHPSIIRTPKTYYIKVYSYFQLMKLVGACRLLGNKVYHVIFRHGSGG